MRSRVKTISLFLLGVFLLPIAARALVYYAREGRRGWYQADWSSAGLLPAAGAAAEPRVLVFSGRTGRWRGIFAVHTWIVVKPENAATYTRYDVTGFGRPLHVNGWAADGRWFGNKPRIVADVRGPAAAAAIPKILGAIAAYPYANFSDYRMWPGPNSNTFVATVLRSIPELAIDMPPEAIGRDFRADGTFIGVTESRTGIEANFWGVLGVKLGWVEGIELNFLSLVAGLDLRHPALKLPGYGRIGLETITATASAEMP
jgi:Protein of unknown function (DUF3750)